MLAAEYALWENKNGNKKGPRADFFTRVEKP